ncbi:MAG: hypothetical protein C4321_10595 [Chloroflexota bacterium]
MAAVTIELPDGIKARLESEWGDLPRRIREAVALEGYREAVLSRGQISELLGLSFGETERFLKEREALLDFTSEELARQIEVAD